MVVTVGTDANVSFVATRLDARGRGLARAVTTTALDDVTQLPRSPVHSGSGMPVRIPVAHGGCAGRRPEVATDRGVGAWGLWFGTDGTLGGCRMTQRQGRRTCTISVVRAATR